MTGAQLYRTFTRVWSGKALRWGALPKEDREKWVKVAEEVSKDYEAKIDSLNEAVYTLQHNANGGWS